MRLVARRRVAIFFFAAALVGLRFGIIFGLFIIPGIALTFQFYASPPDALL
jgi:Na+/H+-dicarboxylate symporter